MTYQNKNQDARDLGGLLICISLIALLLGGCGSLRTGGQRTHGVDFDAGAQCLDAPAFATDDPIEHPSWAAHWAAQNRAECLDLLTECECTTDIDCETRCGGSY